MLFVLPRKLRDQIYRYLVKGTYDVRGQPEWALSEGINLVVLRKEPALFYDPDEQSPYIDILGVSKVIREEAMALQYSESTFRINFDRLNATWHRSEDRVGRMMNIELEANILDGFEAAIYTPDAPSAWEAFLGRISRTDTIRNTLRITWRLYTPKIEKALPAWLYQPCTSMTGFRTVIVKVEPKDLCVSCGWLYLDEVEDQFKGLDTRMELIKTHLERALGPAVANGIQGSGDDSGDGLHPRTLTFHPQKHMSTILRGQAKALREYADKLDLEAGRVEASAREKE